MNDLTLKIVEKIDFQKDNFLLCLGHSTHGIGQGWAVGGQGSR